MTLIITIGGSPGSGKSVIGKMLAAKLGIPYFGMGEIRREYAHEHELTIDDVNRLADSDPVFDRYLDEFMQTLPTTHASFIIDGRTAFHFIPQGVKLFLKTDYRTAANRILALNRKSEHWASIDEGMKALQQREETDNARYQKYYGITPADLSQYDFILDTSTTTVEEALGKIMGFLESKKLLYERAVMTKSL
jgi:predicted cytidylate kinase